eukprot:593575-Rhodomonas_salina.3
MGFATALTLAIEVNTPPLETPQFDDPRRVVSCAPFARRCQALQRVTHKALLLSVQMVVWTATALEFNLPPRFVRHGQLAGRILLWQSINALVAGRPPPHAENLTPFAACFSAYTFFLLDALALGDSKHQDNLSSTMRKLLRRYAGQCSVGFKQHADIHIWRCLAGRAWSQLLRMEAESVECSNLARLREQVRQGKALVGPQ